jgi:hypothetical protein
MASTITSPTYRRRALPAAITVAFLLASPADAELTQLDPGDLAYGDTFGQAVAISGNTAVVSSHQDDAGVGSAYVFIRTGGVWTLQQKLVADDGSAGDFFGTFVAIDGDSVIVGAPDQNDSVGAAYVFVRVGSVWSQQQKLVVADGGANHRFGTSVAISGDTAIVGAPGDDEAADHAGAAYTFLRSGGLWSPEQKLVVGNAAAGDGVGSDVALDGDTAIVSAPHDDEAGPDSGAAYAFVREAKVWTVQQKLTAADSLAGELVGTAVALSGETAVLGALYGFAGGTVTGAAYVFVRSGATWLEEQKLTAFDGTAHDDFGWAVGVAGDVAVGGGDADDEGSGSAHLYLRQDGIWYHQRELTSSHRGGGFGYSVATSGSAVVVGAPLNSDTGAAYVFDVDTTLTHPLEGNRLLIKNRVPDDERSNRITVALKGSDLWLPVPWSSLDPTIAGAVLRVESETSGEGFEQFLPAQNWQRRGTGQSTARYRYSDRELDESACKSATLTKRKVKLTCSGKGAATLDYDLTEGQTQAPVRVTLQFAAGVGYCAEFGGTIARDGSDARSFSAKQAPPLGTCQ